MTTAPLLGRGECDRTAAVTRSLLGYGVLAGPFYVIVSVVQVACTGNRRTIRNHNALGIHLAGNVHHRTHHANVSRGWSTVGLNVQRGRILGAQRAAREKWPYWRRLVQAAAFPLFPLLQLRYLLPSMRRMSIPAALRPRVYASLGATLGVLAAAEAWGLLAGEGNAISRMEDYELHRTRHLSRRERRDLAARERSAGTAD